MSTKIKITAAVLTFVFLSALMELLISALINKQLKAQEKLFFKGVSKDNLIMLVNEPTNQVIITHMACIKSVEDYSYEPEISNLLREIADPVVTINYINITKDKKLVSEIYLNNINLNQHLVAEGVAIIDPSKFNCLDKNGYLYSQKIAKDYKLGVWAND